MRPLRFYCQLAYASLRSIFFNFHYLPLRQAIHLPILLYKPRLFDNTGKIIIDTEVSYGMIRLGFPCVSIYPNNGVMFQNKGTIIFKGKCLMGNDTSISIGPTGKLSLGSKVTSTCGMKLVCYNQIDISDNVLIGWNTLIVDTDFHKLVSVDGKDTNKGFGKILIGENVWIASNVKIYKNSIIPSYCTVAANTIVNKEIISKPYSLIFNPTMVEARYTGKYRDANEDIISYEQ